MRSSLSSFMLLLSCTASVAQLPFTSYTYYGYTGGNVNAVIEASNGDLVIAGNGTETLNNNSDQYAIRFSSSGGLISGLTYYGGLGWNEYIVDGVATPDGGVVLLGRVIETATTRIHMSLFKLDAAGDVVWSHRYRGTDADEVIQPRCIRRDDQGALHVLGSFGDYTTMDLFIAKLEDDGDLTWVRQLGFIGPDEARDMALRPNGGYAIASSTKYYWPRIALLDSACNVQVDRVWQLPDTTLTLYSMALRPDGGITWAGRYMDSTFYQGAFVMEQDTLGNAIWSAAYRDTGGDEFWSEDHVVLPNGDLFLVGDAITSLGYNEGTPLLHIDGAGAVVWSGSSGEHDELSRAVITTLDGGIACGETKRAVDMFHLGYQLKKLDGTGNPACELNTTALVRTGHLPDTLLFPLELLGPKDLLKVSRSISTWPLDQFVDACAMDGIAESPEMSSLLIHPNPAWNEVTIELPGEAVAGTLMLFDIQGREVVRQAMLGAILLDVAGIPSGNYIIRVEDGSRAFHARLLLER